MKTYIALPAYMYLNKLSGDNINSLKKTEISCQYSEIFQQISALIWKKKINNFLSNELVKLCFFPDFNEPLVVKINMFRSIIYFSVSNLGYS